MGLCLNGLKLDFKKKKKKGLGLLTTPKLIVSKHRWSIWVRLGIVCVVVGGPDSILLNSEYSFLAGDSRNHSSGIWIPFKIPSESFDQFGRPLCKIWFLWNSGNCLDSARFQQKSVEDSKDLCLWQYFTLLHGFRQTPVDSNQNVGIPFQQIPSSFRQIRDCHG